MNLPADLITQFAKITKDDKRTKGEMTVYGTIVESDDGMYVKIDGSNTLTPIVLTVGVGDGDRVTVQLKNHTATVTGNISSPAVRTETLKEITGIESVDDLLNAVDSVETELLTERERIDKLEADLATETSRTDSLVTRVADSELRITTLETDLADSVARISTLESSLADLTTVVSSLETRIAALEGTGGDSE